MMRRKVVARENKYETNSQEIRKKSKTNFFYERHLKETRITGLVGQ